MENVMSKQTKTVSPKTLTLNTFQNQLRAWQRAATNNNAGQNSVPVVATHKAAHNPNAHTSTLRRYCAIVEFPLSKGGGYSYYKSRAAVEKFEARASEGYQVTWLGGGR